jgi:CRP-like cAMP-binding protein
VIITRGKARCWHNQLFLGTLGQGSVIGEAVLFLKTNEKIIVTLEALEETEIRLFQKVVLREYFFSSRRNLLLRLSANVIMSLSHKLMKCYVALEHQKSEAETFIKKS